MTTEEGTTAAACEPITDDPPAIGQECMAALCPRGYTCIDINGFAFQQLCGILCDQDCDCPDGHFFAEHSDKVGVW
jgi:hypothetical protein